MNSKTVEINNIFYTEKETMLFTSTKIEISKKYA